MAKVPLTDKFVKAIPPKDKTASYTDTKTRGLMLLVTPKGAKTFYLVRKFEGKVERPKLGRYPDTTLAAARRKAGQLNALFDAGINPEEEKRRKRSELTLNEFFEVYFREHCQLHNKDPEVTRYTYEHYVKPMLGKKTLSEIRRDDVKRMHIDLGRSGRLRTANKAQGCIRAILNKAIAWEYLKGDNPAQHVERFREQSRDRFMSKAELERFHVALGVEDEQMRDIFLVLLYTGARKSEVLTMQWSHLDLESEVWRIPEPKNQEPRRVVLAGPAMVILNRRDAARDSELPWVFPGRVPGKPVQELRKAWDRVLDRAGIDDLRIHDLRRTHASWMLAGGADLPTIAKALGHRDFHSTLVYARLDLDPVRKAVERTVQSLAPKPRLVTDEGTKRR